MLIDTGKAHRELESSEDLKHVQKAPTLAPGLREPLEEARKRLRSMYGDRLRRVILYGSQARGDAREDSDVDVLVVLEDTIENTYREIKRMGDLKMDLYEGYHLYFSFHPYEEEAYQDLRRPFMQNVRAEGIELGRDEVQVI